MTFCATALLPADTPAAVIVALAAVAGVAAPPLGAYTRTLFATLLPDRRTVESAYGVDATASELAWMCGPPLALAVGALGSDGAALALGALIRFVATIGIAAPLLGLWGAGSLAGGVLLARLGARRHSARDLVLLLAALAIGHGALALAVGGAIGAATAGADADQRGTAGLRPRRRHRAGGARRGHTPAGRRRPRTGRRGAGLNRSRDAAGANPLRFSTPNHAKSAFSR